MLYLYISPLRIMDYSPLLGRRITEDWVVPKEHETCRHNTSGPFTVVRLHWLNQYGCVMHTLIPEKTDSNLYQILDAQQFLDQVIKDVFSSPSHCWLESPLGGNQPPKK